VKSLKPLAQGVIVDLRTRGLLPVAILLAVALVAVPALLSRSPEPVVVETAAPIDPVDTGGLPGPAQALGERPLVTLASLDSSSDLEYFSARDPFEPLRTLSAIGDDPTATTATTVTNTSLADAAAAGSTGGLAPEGGFGGAVGGDPSTGGDSDGDTGGEAPTPEPAPEPAPVPESRFTYAVDLTFDGPEGPPRTYRNLPRLSILPNEASPLVIFLGVGANVNNVVFLVDATLRPSPEGEGTCSPSLEYCATVSIEPGEQQIFLDEEDRRYVLQIDQIREVPLVDASQEGDEGPAGSANASIGAPVRRFLPQLTDLLVVGG